MVEQLQNDIIGGRVTINLSNGDTITLHDLIKLIDIHNDMAEDYLHDMNTANVACSDANEMHIQFVSYTNDLLDEIMYDGITSRPYINLPIEYLYQLITQVYRLCIKNCETAIKYAEVFNHIDADYYRGRLNDVTRGLKLVDEHVDEYITKHPSRKTIIDDIRSGPTNYSLSDIRELFYKEE